MLVITWQHMTVLATVGTCLSVRVPAGDRHPQTGHGCKRDSFQRCGLKKLTQNVLLSGDSKSWKPLLLLDLKWGREEESKGMRGQLCGESLTGAVACD